MGRRGPQGIDKERLQFRGLQIASFFFTLRDGRRARIGTQGPNGWIEAATIIPQAPGKARKFMEELGKLSRTAWQVIPEIPPSPAAWEQLKAARKREEILHAAECIRHWARTVGRTDWQNEFPATMRDHAEALLRAKKSWAYPRDPRRPTSDDKRVVFLAKVLAGLTLGLSPAYTIKILAYWPWTKDWIEGAFVAMEKGFGGRIVDFLQRRRKRRR